MRSDFIDESDLEALFHAAPVPDMGVDTAGVVAGARRTRTRRRAAAVSAASALALVVGGVWLGLPGGRDGAATDPAAPTPSTATEVLRVPAVTGLGGDVPGVTFDVRLDPGAGAGGADRVSVSGGGRSAELDVRRDELVGTAGVTRQLGPRDFVVVTDSAVQGASVELTADAERAGGATVADVVLGRSGLRVFALRFERPVRADEVLGTFASEQSQVWSTRADGSAGQMTSAEVPAHEAVLYVDEALDLIGAFGPEGGGSAHLSDTDDRIALLWTGEGTTGAAGLFPKGAQVTSAEVTWDRPGGSPGRRTAEVVTLEPGARTGWYSSIPSPAGRYDMTTATVRWTDQDGTHTASP